MRIVTTLAASTLLLLSPVAILSPAVAQDTTETTAETIPQRVVYVDSLLDSPSTSVMGYWRYQPVTAILNGERWPRSLQTQTTNGAQPTARYSALTLALNGHYDRFTAMLGRDDHDQAMGPGYCVFEVWADGKRIFKSDAIRSSLTPITVSSAYTKRSTPQSVAVSVKGVRSLRLITRYASEFSQQARYVDRAYGCVWGGARLFCPADAAETVEDPVLRASLRRAIVKLLPSLAALGKKTSKNGILHVGIAPLRVDASTVDSPLRHAETETGMRSFLGETLFNIQGGDGPNLAPLTPSDRQSLAVSLPAGSSIRDDPATAATIARRAKADLLMFGAVEPFAGRWRVILRLLDVRKGSGVTLVEVTLPIEADQNASSDTGALTGNP